MEKHCDLNSAKPEEREREKRRQAEREERAMQTPVVTQNTPENTPSGNGPIVNSDRGASPTRQELEQDVMMTNPSVESMESRG